MKQLNYLLFFILIYFFSININASIPSVYVIGYKNGVCFLGDYESSNLYCFNGKFAIHSKYLNNYIPCYVNDSLEIYYSKKNNKEIRIIKGDNLMSFTLPEEPLRVISNTNGDTIFYTVGNEQVEPLRIYIVKTGEIIQGIKVDNERFWYQNNCKIIYSKTKNDKSEIYISYPNDSEKKMMNTLNHPFQLIDISDHSKYLYAQMMNPENQSEQLSIVINLECEYYVKERIKGEETFMPIFYKKNLYLYNLNNPKEFYKSEIKLDSICK